MSDSSIRLLERLIQMIEEIQAHQRKTRLGKNLAVSAFAMFACATTILPNAGCVITERPDYSNSGPNYPPSIASVPGALFPLDRFAIVQANSTGAAMDGGTSTYEFEVYVLDPNIDQTLRANIIVNVGPDAQVFEYLPLDIPPSGQLTRRFTFNIDALRLSRRCNRIELQVSSAFVDGEARKPKAQFDLASAVWYLAFEDSARPPEMQECP